MSEFPSSRIISHCLHSCNHISIYIHTPIIISPLLVSLFDSDSIFFPIPRLDLIIRFHSSSSPPQNLTRRFSADISLFNSDDARGGRNVNNSCDSVSDYWNRIYICLINNAIKLQIQTSSFQYVGWSFENFHLHWRILASQVKRKKNCNSLAFPPFSCIINFHTCGAGSLCCNVLRRRRMYMHRADKIGSLSPHYIIGNYKLFLSRWNKKRQQQHILAHAMPKKFILQTPKAP